MDPVTISTEWANLLTLRVGKLLKEDTDYQLMYGHRLARLQAMSTASGSILDHAKSAISLTRVSHELARGLASETHTIRNLLEENARVRVERVIAADERATSAHAEPVPAALAASLDSLREKAYDFIRWTVSPAGATDADRPMLESLREHLQGEDETDLSLITMVVSRLVMALQNRNHQLQVVRPLTELARISQGLLYVGVMNTTGAALERKELARHLRSVAMDLAGNVVPGLGLLVALGELLDLSDADRPLASVEEARALEEYLVKYRQVIRQWILGAERLRESLARVRTVLETA